MNLTNDKMAVLVDLFTDLQEALTAANAAQKAIRDFLMMDEAEAEPPPAAEPVRSKTEVLTVLDRRVQIERELARIRGLYDKLWPRTDLSTGEADFMARATEFFKVQNVFRSLEELLDVLRGLVVRTSTYAPPATAIPRVGLALLQQRVRAGLGDGSAWVEYERFMAFNTSGLDLTHQPAARPDGRLPTRITFLDMHEHPAQGQPRSQYTDGRNVVSLAGADSLNRLRLNRFWYNRVGRLWLWYERNTFPDAELMTYLNDPNVEFLALRVDGIPAGFCELDWRTVGQCELAYFGLFPEFLGAGHGKWFLNWIVDHVWANKHVHHDNGDSMRRLERFWVYTNILDSKAALPSYIRAGFQPYLTKDATYCDPRVLWPEQMTTFDLKSYPWPNIDAYVRLYTEIIGGDL
jgi:GNAT superfamily N-acetyltransferase